MADIITSERVEGLRVVTDHDKYPLPLSENEGMPYTVRLQRGLVSTCTAEAGTDWAGGLSPGDIDELWAEHRDDEAITAGLRERWGVLDIESITPEPNGNRWYLIATREFAAGALALSGEPDHYSDEQRATIRAALVQAAETATDHVQGNVYRWELQRETTGRTIYYNGSMEETSSWEVEESCGDLVGWKWAQEDAREVLADAELRESVVFPQQRPHAVMPRGPWLWATVTEPALGGVDVAEYFHVRRIEDAGNVGWGVDLRLGWGEDTTTERRFDEHTAWAALIACASGAMRIDAAIALECRDLVGAPWTEYVAPYSPPLSKLAAEIVVQVALIGTAPYLGAG